MTLLVTDTLLRERREVVRGPLAPLAIGLRSELAPLIDHPVEVPREKALLSRKGGRCEVDGTLLTFDPFDARHRCPTCGRAYRGELHDRFRLYWYQLWLAERALHGALLGALAGDAAASALATSLLEQYAEQYLHYPNADNVLGPSRPFFSTYLESIWLLQLALALSLLESTASSESNALGSMVRERLILPSATLIASYDEGMSNRQVWNNAALMASARLLDDRKMFEHAVHGASGLHAHLGNALLEDGTWYEGENYHLFAHRGLWYGERLANLGGEPLPAHLERRYRDAFAAPFRTILPDLTYPSRRDSQYAVSIRQPRFAESCELGLAYGDDERLTSVLARLYDPSIPRGDTGRRSSSADVERNLPATGLDRTDLSWRTLLCARAELPLLSALPLRSDLLPSQGIGIVRRNGGDTYVSLDYGHSGGGHGHPDRLNLTLMDNATRWFDDPGTGSYVDPTLHWYRSTLAHNAPIVDGGSQPRVHGTLDTFEDDGDTARMEARVSLAPGLIVSRRIVVLRDYLVDVLQWESQESHEIGLPMHGVEAAAHRVPAPEIVLGRDGIEDGFDFLEDIARVVMPSSNRLIFQAMSANRGRLSGWTFLCDHATVWTATAPAPPGAAGRRPLTLVTQKTPTGSYVSVWSWGESIVDATRQGDSLAVHRADGSVHLHAWDDTPSVGGTRSPLVERPPADAEHVPAAAASSASAAQEIRSLSSESALPTRYVLGEDHYRPSELSWTDAGAPLALVTISRADGHTVLVEVEVPDSQRRFISLDTENELDNEPASINGDSVQLYATTSVGGAALLCVPNGSGVDARPIDGWMNNMNVRTTWTPSERGYRLSALLDVGADETELYLDVIVNETTPARSRRRGQFVLSGANGEFVYLRGDRHDPSRLLRFLLPQ